jgi:UDP-N-acetyl-2-amino-2-deoxyglucuronate dehydrogenase
MTASVGAVRFGIVGCGGAAVDVARAIDAVAGARVVAVHDRDPARADAIGRPRGATPHRTLRGLLADSTVDAVYVALPHDGLASTSVAALQAGRHVLVEKPMATRLAAIAAVRDAALATDRRVGVVFELRHVPTVAEATRLVRAGSIGRVRSIRIRTLIDKPPAYWSSGPTGTVRDPWRASLRRSGGGVLLMNAIHQLDLVRVITGRHARRVAALTTAGVVGVEVEDAAAAVIDYGDGVVGSLVAAAHAPGYRDAETIEIDGDQGAIRLGDPYETTPTIESFIRRRPDDPEPDDEVVGRWVRSTPAAVDPWVATVSEFVHAIREGRDPVPGIDDAELALATVLAIYRSARTGRFVSVGVGP